MKLTVRQLRKIIKESILLEYGPHGEFSEERYQHLVDVSIDKFVEKNGREPNAEELKKIEQRAFENINMGY